MKQQKYQANTHPDRHSTVFIPASICIRNRNSILQTKRTAPVFASFFLSAIALIATTTLPLAAHAQTDDLNNDNCLECHDQIEIGDAEYPLDSLLEHSVHDGLDCVDCHSDVEDLDHDEDLDAVSCADCHEDVAGYYDLSTHGQLAARHEPNAPMCSDCHSAHSIKTDTDPHSPTFPINVPKLCGSCHREGEKAAERYTGTQHDIVENYSMSIHGKGLLESGLTVTAVCTDCHTAHYELPSSDSASSVNYLNVPATCAKCHHGVYEKYQQSIHYEKFNSSHPEAPNCNDCHHAHTVTRTDENGFEFEIMNQCGNCHEEVMESYFETFHGKVSKLGYENAAKCHDCHGVHDIRTIDDSLSTLSLANRTTTCAKCHEGSHDRFAGYLTHAGVDNREEHPELFYTYWFMMTLLFGVMIVAGAHTLLWLPRSLQAMKERRSKKTEQKKNGDFESRLVFQRFRPYQRRLHVLVVISFLGLALTGMTLKFSYLPWAQWLSALMGGFETAGYVHRLCALITFFYFIAHLYFVAKEKREEHKSWKEVLLSTNSMLPNRTDLREVLASIKWFVGKGPEPQYGRWTYWEKFDYFAVFWGVAIIGASGLLLWFPVFFTRFFPGWIINVATIIHSDEALLAVAFIFTIHFFNTHLRPGKFPMDTVIFTGRMPLEELQKERPREYAELMESGKLKKHLVDPLPEPIVQAMRIFAATALTIGLGLIALIIYAELFG